MVQPVAPSKVEIKDVQQTTASVHWTSASKADEVKSYEVLVNGVVVKTVPATTSFVDLTGLTANTKYDVVVRALGSLGTTPAASSTVSFTSLPIPTPAPLQLHPEDITATTFNAVWNPPADVTGVATYEVFLGDAKVGTVPVGTHTLFVGDLQPEGVYTLNVRAVSASGVASEYANPSTVRLLAGRASPTKLKADLVGHEYVDLSWTPPAGSSPFTTYRLFKDRDLIPDTKLDNKTNKFRVLKLKSNTTYKFEVDAFDEPSQASSARSMPLEITTLKDVVAPSAPLDIKCFPQTSVHDVRPTISFANATDDVSAAPKLKYEVYVNGKYSNTVSGEDTSKVQGTTNYVLNSEATMAVIAVDAVGNKSPMSETVTCKTGVDNQLPDGLTGVVIPSQDITTTSARVAWTLQADNDAVAQMEISVDGKFLTRVPYGVPYSYTLTGLLPNTKYDVRVKPVDRTGNVAEGTPTVKFRTLAVGETPPTFTLPSAKVTVPQEVPMPKGVLTLDVVGLYLESDGAPPHRSRNTADFSSPMVNDINRIVGDMTDEQVTFKMRYNYGFLPVKEPVVCSLSPLKDAVKAQHNIASVPGSRILIVPQGNSVKGCEAGGGGWGDTWGEGTGWADYYSAALHELGHTLSMTHANTAFCTDVRDFTTCSGGRSYSSRGELMGADSLEFISPTLNGSVPGTAGNSIWARNSGEFEVTPRANIKGDLHTTAIGAVRVNANDSDDLSFHYETPDPTNKSTLASAIYVDRIPKDTYSSGMAVLSNPKGVGDDVWSHLKVGETFKVSATRSVTFVRINEKGNAILKYTNTEKPALAPGAMEPNRLNHVSLAGVDKSILAVLGTAQTASGKIYWKATSTDGVVGQGVFQSKAMGTYEPYNLFIGLPTAKRWTIETWTDENPTPVSNEFSN